MAFFCSVQYQAHSLFTEFFSEKEVKGVSERLASLEKAIHTLVTNSKPSASINDQTWYTNTTEPSKASEDGHDVPFEGASSFTAHSRQASQAFRSAATFEGLPSEALTNSSLGRIGGSCETAGFVGDAYRLPPVSIVLKTLRAAKSRLIKPESSYR